MKYWMPGLVALMAVPTAQAMNYRLVYSPSQKLEVFIDDVKNSNPESWCGKSIPLRIVSAQSQDPAVLNDFLPRVGNLLEKQCPKAGHLPWTLTDKRGESWPAAKLPKCTAGNRWSNRRPSSSRKPRRSRRSLRR